MVVEHEVRHPRVIELQPALHLRRCPSDVVAIEIELLRLRPGSGDLGAILVGAVEGTPRLVAIDIEHRYHDEDRAIQPRRLVRTLGDNHIAHQHQRSVLAFDLTGVDAALYKDDGLIRLRRCGRGKGFVRRYDQRVHRASLGRGSKLNHLYKWRRVLHLAHQRDGFIVGGGLLPLCLLTGGQQVRGHARAARCKRSSRLRGRRFIHRVRSQRRLLRHDARNKSHSKRKTRGISADTKHNGSPGASRCSSHVGKLGTESRMSHYSKYPYADILGAAT